MGKLRMPVLPQIDTIKARLYDMLPHRAVDPSKAVGFVAKAVRQIEATERRVEAQHRAAVRSIGRARSKHDATADTLQKQITDLHKQIEKARKAMLDQKAAAFAKQDALGSVRGKLTRAKANLKAIVEG